MMKLLEHHSIVIRGKTLLTFLLLFKTNFRWMTLVGAEGKFYHILDRMARENYKYVQFCLYCLYDGIFDIIPTVFKIIAEEVNLLIKGTKPN